MGTEKPRLLEPFSYLQQGDVLITEDVSKFDILKNFKGTKKVGSTLELGEHTGHHHTCYLDKRGKVPAKINLYEGTYYSEILKREVQAKIFEVVDNEVYLRHQQHRMIPIKKGNYVQVRKKTWDYTEQVERRALD